LNSILYIVLADFEADGIELNDQILDARLSKELQKILEASDKDVA
jgi:hypothetical protein